MLLFRSEEDIERWSRLRGTARGEVMSVEQQWRLARAWFENRLQPGFRRRTVEEAEAVFTGIGLTGPFWSLQPAPPARG
jgi:hypothetical protein